MSTTGRRTRRRRGWTPWRPTTPTCGSSTSPTPAGPGGPATWGPTMARGEYVYYVDNDDWVGHEALERLYATAKRDEADIVIGKVVGHGKIVPRSLFTQNRSDATLEWMPLLRLLTPHKLFRREFLAEHGIRF